jgi:hypothetical protein
MEGRFNTVLLILRKEENKMRMYKVRYRLKKEEYVQKLYAQNLRTARHKLAVQHKVVIQAIKILDCVECD